MRKLIHAVLATLLLAAGTNALAATAADFYLSLLRRGITDFDAGRYDVAARNLRIAAFGLIESIDNYEVAQVYLAVAQDKLTNEAGARDAARRIVAAERVQRRFASLQLPAAVRTAFLQVTKKVLSAGDQSVLTSAPGQPLPPAPAAVEAKPAPQTSSSAQPPLPNVKPIAPAAVPAVKAPEAKPPAPKPAAPRDAASILIAAERALAANNLTEARGLYRQILETRLDHSQFLRVAEGLYRARDFEGARRAFDRLGNFRRGEEPYRYYLAVALFETGRYKAAKRELTAVLPYIEVTPDVAAYRKKIETAK